MKPRFFVLPLFIFFSFVSFAQQNKQDSLPKSSDNKYRFELGYGQTYRHGDYIVTSTYHVMRAGGLIEIPVKYGFGIETGLKYSYVLGNREQLYNNSDTAFFSYSGHWLDVPVRVIYTQPIFWGIKLFGFAGPNFNIGLSQTSKTTFESKETEQTNPLNLPVSGTYNLYDTEINRFSIQLGAGGGIQWRNYRIKSGYDWGVSSISKTKGRSQKLRGWYVAFEYEF